MGDAPRPFQRLQRRWQSLERPLKYITVDEDRIRCLEDKYRISIPNDFRDYLNCATPADEFFAEVEFPTTWWHFERIKNIPDELEHPLLNPTVAESASQYLFFADYMSWCMAWAICCADSAQRGKIVVINGTNDRFVADSFATFVDRMIADPTDMI